MALFGRRRGETRRTDDRLSIVHAADDSPNGWYRARGPMEALRLRGHRVRRLDGAGARTETLDEVDVLHLHRYWDDVAIALARRARARGVAVVWDDDDDFAAVPRGLPGAQRFRGLGGRRRSAQVRKMVGLADLVTVPGEHLAGRLRELGADDPVVLPNYLPDGFVRAATAPSEPGVTLGWVAGLEHQFDLDRLGLRAVFEHLLERHPTLRISTIGVNPGLRSERVRHEAAVPFDALPQRIASFDVAVAPLADVPFNRARSDIKLKEYAAAGVPWAASSVGPYVALGEREGGMLVSDDGWAEALDGLLGDAKLRARLGKQARRWGREQTISANAHRWEDAFGVALRRARARAA